MGSSFTNFPTAKSNLLHVNYSIFSYVFGTVVLNIDPPSQQTNPIISSSTFQYCYEYEGSALNLRDNNVQINNCMFFHNIAFNGIVKLNGPKKAELNNSIFYNNTAKLLCAGYFIDHSTEYKKNDISKISGVNITKSVSALVPAMEIWGGNNRISHSFIMHSKSLHSNAAIRIFKKANHSVSQCTFYNLTSPCKGVSLYLATYGNQYTISNCIFSKLHCHQTNNTAIFVPDKKVKLSWNFISTDEPQKLINNPYSAPTECVKII